MWRKENLASWVSAEGASSGSRSRLSELSGVRVYSSHSRSYFRIWEECLLLRISDFGPEIEGGSETLVLME